MIQTWIDAGLLKKLLHKADPSLNLKSEAPAERIGNTHARTDHPQRRMNPQ